MTDDEDNQPAELDRSDAVDPASTAVSLTPDREKKRSIPGAASQGVAPPPLPLSRLLYRAIPTRRCASAMVRYRWHTLSESRPVEGTPAATRGDAVRLWRAVRASLQLDEGAL
ncbi:MAG: hypothetical protein ACOX2L_05405 [Anaerolineae bacterium]|jgi:hypothetical protein